METIICEIQEIAEDDLHSRIEPSSGVVVVKSEFDTLEENTGHFFKHRNKQTSAALSFSIPCPKPILKKSSAYAVVSDVASKEDKTLVERSAKQSASLGTLRYCGRNVSSWWKGKSEGIVGRRHLIFDKPAIIPPKQFKRQLYETSDILRTQEIGPTTKQQVRRLTTFGFNKLFAYPAHTNFSSKLVPLYERHCRSDPQANCETYSDMPLLPVDHLLYPTNINGARRKQKFIEAALDNVATSEQHISVDQPSETVVVTQVEVFNQEIKSENDSECKTASVVSENNQYDGECGDEIVLYECEGQYFNEKRQPVTLAQSEDGNLIMLMTQ